MNETKFSKPLFIGLACAAMTGLQINSFKDANSFPTTGTLRQKVDATCGGCHNNEHFTTAGGYSLASGAAAHTGGVFAQSLSIDPTAMTGGNPETALIVSKPLEGVMAHGGIDIPVDHPTIVALKAWVQAGAPAAQLDYPVQAAPAYYGGADPVLVYSKSRAQPGGFRDLNGNGLMLDAGTDRDGDIWLLRYNAATNAVIQNINLTNFPANYNARSPYPSLDGSKIVFSYRIGSNPWRIGEVNSNGSGLRDYPLPSGSNYMQPVYLNYLPDGTPARSGEGGIAFLSDRPGFRDEYEVGTTFSLHVADASGGNLRQISFQPSHNIHPTMHSSGLVVFTDWQHNEHQGHNFMPIFSMCASDYESAGTNFFAAYGEHHTSPAGNSLHQAQEIFTAGHDGEMIAQGSMRDDAGGSIVGPFFPRMAGTTGNPPQTNVIAWGDNFEPGDDDAENPVPTYGFTYRGPNSMLNHYVVSHASFTGAELVFNEFTNTSSYVLSYGHFKLETFELNGSNQMTNERTLLEEAGYSLTDAKPLLIKPTPPMIGKPIDSTKNTGIFTSGNVRRRQPDGQPATLSTNANDSNRIAGVRFLRALQRSQGTVETGRDTDEGIATQFIGVAPVFEDGSVAAEVPAEVPIQFQLVNAEGRVVVNHKPWVFVQRGETMRCVGCHAGHDDAPAVDSIEARQSAPHILTANAAHQSHFDRDIQPILTNKCASCHDSALVGGAAGRDRGLSLVGRRVPGASNVTEAYQSLVGRSMSMNTAYVVTQRPNDSPLIWWLTGQRLNATPPTAYPTPSATVPHDQILTTDELDEIIDWINNGRLFRSSADNTTNPLRALNINEFAQNVWPILETACYSCHSDGNAGANAMNLDPDDDDIETQEDLDEARAEIVADRANFMIPEASPILRKPNSDDPLTHVGGKLWNPRTDEYRAIYAWITAANPALAAGVPGTDLHNVKAFPNPFRDSTNIVYGLSGSPATSIEIRIYSQTGKLIRELPGTTNNGGANIGWNRVEWNGEDKNGKVVGNDVYFIAIEAKFADGTKKTMRQKCVKIK